MKITDIQLGIVKIPLKRPFRTALRQVTDAEDLVVKIITDDGHVGYGNAPATLAITGDSLTAIAAAIGTVIAPKIKGSNIEDLQEIRLLIQTAMAHNTSAKAAVDIAVHDLFCQHYRMPLYRFFGGAANTVSSDLTISINEPETMVKDALAAVKSGYGTLKIKVGTDAALDFQRIRAVRSALGPGIRLRLDANQGWKPKEAVRLIRAFEDADFSIELIEQPVRAHDIDGLKFVTDHVATDIMADESCFSAPDAFRLLALRACDLLNIKLIKAGGLAEAAKIAALASAAGIGTMMGCMLESKIGVTAAAALSAGCGTIGRNDLDAADLQETDPIIGGIRYEEDMLLLPEAPGLGISEVTGWQPLSMPYASC